MMEEHRSTSAMHDDERHIQSAYKEGRGAIPLIFPLNLDFEIVINTI